MGTFTRTWGSSFSFASTVAFFTLGLATILWLLQSSAIFHPNAQGGFSSASSLRSLPSVHPGADVALVSATPTPLLSPTRAAAAEFDVSHYPAYLINMPDDWRQCKWAELQLASIGYSSYTRINGSSVPRAVCKETCQDGLLLAHLAAWEGIVRDGARRAAERIPPARGYLIVEDDVVFHRDFLTLWPRYAKGMGVPPSFSVVYVGVFVEGEVQQPSILQVLETDSVPWTTHAYIVSLETAQFFARLLDYLLARAAAPAVDMRSPFIWGKPSAESGSLKPFEFGYPDMKIDYFMRWVHHYFFKRSSSVPPGSAPEHPLWYAFHSTTETPAALGLATGAFPANRLCQAHLARDLPFRRAEATRLSCVCTRARSSCRACHRVPLCVR